MNLRELLNEREVFNEYRLSIPWQRKTRRIGGGPAFLKIGKRMIRYRREDIEDFLSRHRVESKKL